MEEELQRLVIRLIGDVDQYLAALKNSQAQTASTAESIQNNMSKVDRSFQLTGRHSEKEMNAVMNSMNSADLSIKNVTHTVTSMLPALIRTAAGFSILHQAFNAFAEREQVLVKLTATLEANGRAVEETMASYKAFAEEMSQLTLTSKGETLGLLTQAETFELTGDMAEKAAKGAISFAAAGNASAQSMLRLSVALLKGDIEGAMHFKRMIPQLRNVKDEQEFMRKATDLMNTGFARAQALSETTSGQLTHLANNIRSLKADMGETVANGINPIVKGLLELTQVLKGASPEVKSLTAAIIGLTVVVSAMMAVLTLATAPWMRLATVWAAVAAAAVLIMGTNLNVWVKTLMIAVAGLAAVTWLWYASMGISPITAWIAVIALAAAGIVALYQTVYNARQEVKDLNAEMERTKELDEKRKSMAEGRTAKDIADADKLTGAERSKFLEDLMTRATKEQEQLKNTLGEYTVLESDTLETIMAKAERAWFNPDEPKRLEKALKELEDRYKSLKTASEESLVTKTMKDKLEELLTKTKEGLAKVGRTAAEEHIDKITRHLTPDQKLKLQPISKEILDVERQTNINKMLESMDDEVAKLGRIGEKEAEIAKLRKKGADEAILLPAILRAQEVSMEKLAQKTRDQAREGYESYKNFRQFSETVEGKRGKFGEALTTSGSIGRQDAITKTMEELEKINERILRDQQEGSGAETAALKVAREKLQIQIDTLKIIDQTRTAQELLFDIVKEGKKTVEEFLTPQEKLNNKIHELQRQFEAGALGDKQGKGAEILQKGINKAREEMDKATDSTSKLNQELQKLEGTATGSAAAASKIAAYKEWVNKINPAGVQLGGPLGPAGLPQVLPLPPDIGKLPVPPPAGFDKEGPGRKPVLLPPAPRGPVEEEIKDGVKKLAEGNGLLSEIIKILRNIENGPGIKPAQLQ